MMTEATDKVRSWFSENLWLVIGQIVAVGGAFATLFAYGVKLETRVSIMETRGAEYTVERLSKIDGRLTVLEQQLAKNSASIERVVDVLTRELNKPK
jgi:hypothetical protein